MYDLFKGDEISKLWTLDKIFVDNWMFRLHYVVTVTLLVAYSALSVIDTYAGDPIDCLQGNSGSEDLQKFVDSYCYIQGTRSLKWPTIGKAHDTVGPMDPTYCSKRSGESEPAFKQRVKEDCIEEHPHYQWVALFIVIQAGIFYIPRFFWLSWEGGKMEDLVGDLATTPKFVNDKITDNDDNLNFTPSGDVKTKELAETFYKSTGTYRFYVIKFLVAEFLCLVVVIIQIYLTDTFLGNNFMSFGSDVIKDVAEDQMLDPMGRVLPIVTMCSLSYHGAAGGQVKHDSVCVLPQNIVHQKFYVFFWFWLVLLTVITAVHQIWRVVLIAIPEVRTTVSRTFWTNATKKVDNKVDEMMKKKTFEDWFVLSLIHANLPNVTYQLFKEDLAYVYDQKQN